ncbi:MAG: hypothetical protein NTY75_03855 [Candidatus Shapirobacteria bacterium]|nr:hypothetical protein [Candidatus Shapirobacteria bacterium]
MEIPNLSTIPEVNKPIVTNINQPVKSPNTLVFSIIVVVLALVAGFGLSRLLPKSSTSGTNSGTNDSAVSADTISNTSDLVVGKLYGNSEKTFKDIATGTIEKGSINGEGTHILNRDGGISQRASLISSSVDLDLFVGKRVEVKGETNASTKTAWLLDVGTIKILQ